ncbi:hypothetical protein Tco_0070836 [Tanacetum coccineum]
MFIKYSTSQISPKKSRGKGSKGKRTADTPVIDVDVAEVSEPELSRKRTTSKSISLTEAKEEATRKVHATHARIVTESVLEPTRRKLSGKVTSHPPKKFKSVLSLTLEEQEVADIIKALKESRKTSRRQLGIRGSSEGIGSKLGVPDESIVVSATSSEGTGTKPWVPDEEKVISKEKLFLNKSIDLELTDDEETNDEFVHSGEYVQTDDEETNDEFVQDDEEITDAAKADVEKKEEVKDAAKKAELPLTSSSLSVSSGFGDSLNELEAEIYEAGAQLMGLQFLPLELRLEKIPSRCFRPVKSAEIL